MAKPKTTKSFFTGSLLEPGDPPDISTPVHMHPVPLNPLLATRTGPIWPTDYTVSMIPEPIGYATPLQYAESSHQQIKNQKGSVLPFQNQPSPSSDMEMATSPSDATDVASQRELPGVLPTPGRELGKLVGETHDNWTKIHKKIGKQNYNLEELSKQTTRSRFHVEAKLKSFAEKTDQNFTKLNTVVVGFQQNWKIKKSHK